MKKAVLLIMILTIFSKFIGFFRDITLSYFYGASGVSDAYLISLTIPTVIFGFVATGISTGYIPMYSRIEEKEGERQSKAYTNNLLNILLVFATVVVILGLIFTEILVRLFASGFTGDILDLAVTFTRISIVGIYFTMTIRILSAYLNMKKYYVVPTLIGLPLNIVLIISIILSDRYDFVLMLAIGNVVAIIVQFLILIYFAHRKGFRYQFIFKLKDEHIKNMVFLAIPVIIGSSVNQINKLVDRTLASQISIGGISALNYANTLNLFVQGVFVVSISTVMYPLISKMASKGNMDGLKKALGQSITGINLLVIPATVGSLFFAEPIVALLFGRGAFDEQAITMTAAAFFFYSIGMIGYGLREVLSRAFYSMQDTRTPMINAALAMILNIILNFILSKYLGIGGLALATSIAAIFGTVLLYYSLRKKIGPLDMKNISLPFLKISLASLIMGGTAKLLYEFLLSFAGLNLSLISAIVFAAVIYFVLVSFMKIKDADELIAGLRRKILKR
ncbi:murein biosynthesis integral membrane protein MurJ [Planococcus sp. CPCC 101016]|uniref:murein biosynthesis integral membrane protein MurJ n=1 Tax=Planococcus sp. CPCC 101016 TaxID=2599617 RepID=UPI0011B7B349|nr:murein biosynthesis integral membrane protein MurJ [Planococcus sp. CPCC 101016]TWT07929.1 murein biosynthesis integral membrane protein MurJ [Planococcus sp. CPCC 101016]